LDGGAGSVGLGVASMATRFVMGQAVNMMPSRVVVGAAVVNLTLEERRVGQLLVCVVVREGEGRSTHRAPMALLNATSSSPGPCCVLVLGPGVALTLVD